MTGTVRRKPSLARRKSRQSGPHDKWMFLLFQRVRGFVVIEEGRRVNGVTDLNEGSEEDPGVAGRGVTKILFMKEEMRSVRI
ncbi:MAG: hypothetical protein LLF90_01720 [Methanomicrobiaceae archaeon]|uniref:hypothetical protein n=1 Tax=Methanoculleus sp. TaxID=90427 RepID=UPI00320C0DED|nr:hypothetical protein [Methanomicrobiaceae archaeon]